METSASCENAETITSVKEDISIKEESYEEKGQEHKPAGIDGISEHGIPKQENFPPVDLNNKIQSAEVEIPEKNVNDLHVTHLLAEEMAQVECEKLDEVSKFQPQEVNEANGASAEGEKKIEEAYEACQSTESATLEHTSIKEAAARELISSEIDDEKLPKIYGLDFDEKLGTKDAGQNIDEETQKNEDTIDTEMHKITPNSDNNENAIIEGDDPVKICSTVGASDETVESLEEAAPEIGDNRTYKAEDVERNNIIEEEVHDGPKITGTGEVTEDYIMEGNVRPSEKMKDEKHVGKQTPYDGIGDASISAVTENPDIQNDNEAILETGEGAKDKPDSPGLSLLKDETPVEHEIQDKNNFKTPFIQTEEVFLQKVEKPEIFKEVFEIGSEEAVKESPKELEDQTEILEKTNQVDSTTTEKGKDEENHEQKLEDSFINYEESVQTKGWLAKTEGAEESSRDEKFTVVVAEDSTSNTEIEAEEHGKKETSKHEDGPDQSFLQPDEPKKEKLERSFNVVSETMETSASCENAETINCFKEDSSNKNLEGSYKEKEKEDNLTDTDGSSEHRIPKEENFPPGDLNKEIESAEVQILEKNVNDLNVTHTLVEETEQVECEKLDEVSNFQPQEVNEANGASAEEDKQIEEASKACKSTESTGLEPTTIEDAATVELISSKIDAVKLQKIYGLDSEEKLEAKDDGENTEEETQKNEAIDSEMQKITTKSDDTEKSIIEEDTPAKVCSAIGTGDEMVEQSCQVETLEEAAEKLSSDSMSYKAEDDVERKNIIDEEVRDEPKTTGTGEVIKEHTIEGNIRHISPESIEEETSFQEKEKEAERSRGEDTKEQIAEGGNVTDHSPQSVAEGPVKNFQGDEKEAENFERESFEEFGTAAAGESIECETNKDNKSPEKTCYASSVKQDGSLQEEVEHLSPTEALEEEKREDDRTSVMITGDEYNITRLVKVEENSEKETSKDDEDAKQILQQDEPDEKLGSLNVMPEETEEGLSSENADKIYCKREEGVVQHLEEILEKEMEEEAKIKREEAAVQNLEEISPESTGEETSKISEENEMDKEKPRVEEKLERSLNVISETMETSASWENAETINYVKEDKSLKNLEESNKEKEKEDKPADADGSSENRIPKQENLPPFDFNKEIGSAEVQMPEENVNNLNVTQSLVEETEQGECEKLDEVSNFQDQEVNEANEASAEEEKQIEEASEVCKSTKSTSLEHTSTEEAATKELIASKRDAEKHQKIQGLNYEEKLEPKDDGENTEETQKYEVIDTEIHTIATKSDDIEKSIIEEDAPAKVCSAVGTGDEMVEQSFQMETLQAAGEKSSNDAMSYRAEEDVERNNITDEEVHGGPKTTSTREVVKEHIIEGNIRHMSPESTEEETAKSFHDNEKEAEKSKGEDTKEHITEEGNVKDLSAESVGETPVKNFQDDEKEAENFKGKSFEEFKKAEAGESIACETNQDDKSPDKICYASSVKEDENLQGEGENLSPTKALEQEKREDGRTSVVIIGDEDNITGPVKVEENSEKETSKDDEDAKQIFQQDEPDEKPEQSLNVMSEETEEGVSSENADKVTCKREEGGFQHPEEILEKEMEEKQAKDNREEAAVQNLEEISPESTGEETSKISEANEKDEKKINVETCEQIEKTSVNEGIDRQYLEEEKTIENESTVPAKEELNEESSKEDDIVAKMPKKEVCEIIQTAGTGKQIMEEDSAVMDDFEVNDGPKITSTGEVTKEHIVETSIGYASSEQTEEETVKIFQDNEKEAKKREETKEQVIEEGNVLELSSESAARGPVKNFQDDEKEAEKFEGEIFEESKTAKEGENTAHEINQADEIPERIFYASSMKQEVQGEGENLSLMEALKEEEKDWDKSSVLVTGDENITKLVDAKENTENATSKDDEDKQILQQDEPGEKLEQLLNVMSKETEEGVSSENTEKIISTREETSVQNLEETLEIEMKEDSTKHIHDTEEDGSAKDEDSKLVSEAFEASKSTLSTVFQQNLEESEIEVEKLKRECELDSKEEFEGKNASDNIEEETKNEETSDICLHKVETKYASTEKSMTEDDATVKDSPTVCIGDKAVELCTQEDEKTQKGAEEAEPKTKDGKENFKTDNETEYLKSQSINEEVYEGPKIAGMGEDTEKHIIQEEHTVIDVTPESIGEETSKSSEEDEKEEERPKVEMCEELKTTSAGEGIEKQNLEEENAIKNRSIEPVGVEINEESSKDDMVVRMPKQEVCEIIEASYGGEDTGKHNTEEKSAVRDESEVSETTSAGQDTREQIIKEVDNVKDHPRESIDKETLVENFNKAEEGEGFETSASSTNTEKQKKEECATPGLSSLSAGEETVEESSKEDESDAIKLKEKIEATGSTEETILETLGDRAETNNELDALNTTETSEEETRPKESNENLVENYLASKVSEKEIKTEILEKEEPTINDSDSASVTVVSEEIRLKGAEPEDKKENLESADLGEKLECTSKPVVEVQCSNKPLPEISQTQIEENEQAGPKLDAEDHIKETQNANETIKDVILTEKVPEESEKADENENIKEQIIQEESDRKELHTVSTKDETDNKEKNPCPVSIENLKATNSNEQIETMNFKVEEDLDREREASLLTKASEKATMEKGDTEKTIDDFILVSEASEEKIKEEILEQANDCYDKLDTTSVTEVTEKNLEEPEKTINNNSSKEASKYEEILDSGSSDKKADDMPTTRSMHEEILPEVGEKCEKASNLEFRKMNKTFESASEVQSHDVLTKSGETEIKEQHLEAAMITLKAEENQANEITMNEVSNEKIAEKMDVTKGSYSVSIGEDTIKEIHQEDELKAVEHPGKNIIESLRATKNEIQSDELSKETEKTSASENIIKQIAHEDRALGDPCLVSVKDKTITESLPNEALEQNVEKAAVKLNLQNQGDATNFRESKTEDTTKSEEVNIELEKHDLDTSSTNDKKETAITKRDKSPDTNLRVPPETNATAEEVPHEKIGEEIEKASECYPKEQVAEVLADNPENPVEGKRHKHASLEVAWDGIDVKEDLKLEGQEVYDNKPGTSSVSENSQEEILDKNSKFGEDDEKQHDWEFDEIAPKMSITAEGKGIKEEREQTKDEEPLEISMRENERKPDQAEIQSTINMNEEREIQDQSEMADDLAHIQDLSLVISQKEGSMVPAEAIETIQKIQKIEKTSHLISEKQILREADPSEIAETVVSTDDTDALLVVQDPIAKTLQKTEVKDQEPGNDSETAREFNGETTKESASNDIEKISMSNLLKRSTKETMQRAANVTKDKEQMANKEDMQTEEVETLQVEAAAKTDEEKDEEEEGDNHKKADSGSDASVMVEASRDMDIKTPHKKSHHHNILSGVGSKVKHSIAKVKKAITGKSSHSKTQSSKEDK